ncbi:MAG TPA: glycoside hydrolase family 44 protein, partial [Chloroflexota bacterium]|nr:glycoside hydrolase family 44 protein [Chloroflexota bacterium]
MKRTIGAGLLIILLAAAAFFGLTGRGHRLAQRLRTEIHQVAHSLHHAGSSVDLSLPPSDQLLVGPASTVQPLRVHPIPIYRAGALNSNWQDWSWAAHTLSTHPPGAGTGAISVTYGAWAGLSFHAIQPISAWAGTVDLTLGGGARGGQQVGVALVDTSGNWGKRVSLSSYLPNGNLAANQWVTVRVPLEQSLARGTAVGGIVLQEDTGKAQPTMYISSMSLEVASLADFPVGQTAITLNVNAQAERHPISPYIYGLAADDGTAYDQQIRPTMIRWGGNPSSRYNWYRGNAWNTASDYYYENTNYGSPPGSAADSAIVHSKQIGAAEWLTIPTLGWVAKDTSSFSFPGPDGKPTNGQGSSCTNQKVTADPTRTSIQVGPS